MVYQFKLWEIVALALALFESGFMLGLFIVGLFAGNRERIDDIMERESKYTNDQIKEFINNGRL